MVAVAVALCVLSALLVATTWKVPKTAGAEYSPLEWTVPPEEPSSTDPVTDVSVAPVTVAANCWLPISARGTDKGEIVTVTAAKARDGEKKIRKGRKSQPACALRRRVPEPAGS
jgi:hypothetical protein